MEFWHLLIFRNIARLHMGQLSCYISFCDSFFFFFVYKSTYMESEVYKNTYCSIQTDCLSALQLAIIWLSGLSRSTLNCTALQL